MVGPPKTLQDLRKVEGAVRVTCRACRRVTLHDREEMIQLRSAGLQSCDWQSVIHGMLCGHCLSKNVKVSIEAFAEGLPELRRRRAAMITIELALIILRRASYSGSRDVFPVEAVRLALRALHPFLGDRGMLERFWMAYANPSPHPWGGPGSCFNDLVRGLMKRGFAVPAEFR